jgi:hypothetical protein
MDANDSDLPPRHDDNHPDDEDPNPDPEVLSNPPFHPLTVGLPCTPGTICVGEIVPGAQSLWDTSSTRPGSVTNVTNDITVGNFLSNLFASGYSVYRQIAGKNGPVTVLNNGAGSTYSVYTRSSTEQTGAEFKGPDGQSVKINLLP